MKQMDLVVDNVFAKKRKRVLLLETELVVQWAELVALIEPYTPKAEP